MKTVKIPTCANPFVVIVNGIKYTYPAGATMEVPDDVAEVIEQHEEAKTEPAPVQPPYSGGMNGDDILAAAKAYTDKKCAGAGGGLPVVELSTTLTADAVFTEDEQAALTAAHESGTPFVIKCALNYKGQNMSQTDYIEVAADNVTAVANTISIGVEESFLKCILIPFVGSTVVIMNVGNGWGVTCD